MKRTQVRHRSAGVLSGSGRVPPSSQAVEAKASHSARESCRGTEHMGICDTCSGVNNQLVQLLQPINQCSMQLGMLCMCCQF